MPNNSTNDIMIRRNKLTVLLAQKQPLNKCAKMLNVSYDTILDDKKAIEQQGQEFWFNITNNKYMAYNQFLILVSMEKIQSRLWNIVDSRNKNITIKDKLNAYRLLLDAGNYQERIFVNTPELLTLKELEDKSSKLNDNIILDKTKSIKNTENKQLKRLMP